MKKKNLDPSQFTNPIPKSSKFAVNDWILKWYGQRSGKIAKIIGYQSGYYGTGNYLIEFENGYRMATKPKYFRGPYKTKEIALRFQQNSAIQEKPEDLRLKPSAIRSDYKTVPKIEKILKETYTQEPYNFKWLDEPISVHAGPLTPQTIITILAVRNDPNINIEPSYKYTSSKQRLELTQFCIIRLNDNISKNLITKDYSPYHIYYPQKKSSWFEGEWNFELPSKEQANKLFRIQTTSYAEMLRFGSVNLKDKFNNYNYFLKFNKLTPVDLLEVYGEIAIEGNKKVLKATINLERLGIQDQSIIRDYDSDVAFDFTDEHATNLDNCPRTAPIINVVANNLTNLSSSNNPKVNQIDIGKAPKIKDLTGIDTFQAELVSVGSRWRYVEDLENLVSLKGCPSNVSLSLANLPKLKTLESLPKTLKRLDIFNMELDKFDCRDTKIEGTLKVNEKPKSLAGLPQASAYDIEGYTDDEIKRELAYRDLIQRVPELDGIF